MRKALLVPLLGAIAFVVPTTAGASVFKGVVIARSQSHAEIVVAAKSGAVTTLRVTTLVAPGTIVSASARALGDGTFRVSRLHVLGRSARAAFTGVLLKNVGGSAFFSAGRSIVVVSAGARTVASARSTSPLQPGTTADVSLTITPQGALTANSITPTGETTDRLTLQVTVTAITPATATAPGSLTLQVNGQALVIPLPAGTQLPTGIVANATVNLTIDFRQGAAAADDGVANDDDNNEDGDGHDQGEHTATITATAPPVTGSTTTQSGSGSGLHGDDGGHGHGGGGDD